MDKFSNLPKEITESILTRMPLKDAVRTSILSKKWRHKWTSISCLVFTRECCPASYQGKDKWQEREAKLTSIVDHVLSLHTGSAIQVFKVTQSSPCLQVESWLRRVCQSYVKEVKVHPKGDSDKCKWSSSVHPWSSSLYRCTTLTHLELKLCMVPPPPPPPFFDGLKNLKTLHLMDVSLSEDVLQGILCGCPALENLRVYTLGGISCLRIDAPRLRSLDYEGRVHTITFGEPHPELTDVRVWYRVNVDKGKDTRGHMTEFFAKIPNVQTLAIEGLFLEYLSGVLIDLIPNRLPTPCHDLRSLTLLLDCHNPVLIFGALCILRSTPNLTTLTITDMWRHNRQLENIEWECVSCTLDKLTPLVVQQHMAEPREEDEEEEEEEEQHFIRFLLENSTALQKMTIRMHQLDKAPYKPNYQPYTQAQIEFALYEYYK